MKIAHLTSTLTAVAEYPVSLSRLMLLYPGRSFPRTLVDETIADLPRAVLVRETPMPTLEFGDVLTELPPELLGDGRWHQQWQVTIPNEARIAEMQGELREKARHIAERKMEPPLTSVEGMTYAELFRAESDPALTEAAYPLLIAIKDGRGLSVPATLAWLRARLDAWNARAKTVQTKLHDVLVRINGATTGAELKALQDELEAFV